MVPVSQNLYTEINKYLTKFSHAFSPFHVFEELPTP